MFVISNPFCLENILYHVSPLTGRVKLRADYFRATKMFIFDKKSSYAVISNKKIVVVSNVTIVSNAKKKCTLCFCFLKWANRGWILLKYYYRLNRFHCDTGTDILNLLAKWRNWSAGKQNVLKRWNHERHIFNNMSLKWIIVYKGTTFSWLNWKKKTLFNLFVSEGKHCVRSERGSPGFLINFLSFEYSYFNFQ